jgi:hypothetical protein
MECSTHKTNTITGILQSSPTFNRNEGLQLSRVNFGEILWEMWRRYSTEASPHCPRIKQHICWPFIIIFQVAVDPPFTKCAVAILSLYSINRQVALLTPFTPLSSPSGSYFISAGQQMPCLLYRPKIHYRPHKRPPLDPILSQLKLRKHTPSSICIVSVSPKLRFLLFTFSQQN